MVTYFRPRLKFIAQKKIYIKRKLKIMGKQITLLKKAFLMTDKTVDVIRFQFFPKKVKRAYGNAIDQVEEQLLSIDIELLECLRKDVNTNSVDVTAHRSLLIKKRELERALEDYKFLLEDITTRKVDEVEEDLSKDN